MSGEIVHRHHAALVLELGDDALGDPSAVEDLAAVATELLEHAREPRVAEALPDPRRGASDHELAAVAVRGELPLGAGAPPERGHRLERETFARETHRRGEHPRHGQPAELAVDGEPRVGGAGDGDGMRVKVGKRLAGVGAHGDAARLFERERGGAAARTVVRAHRTGGRVVEEAEGVAA